MFDPEESIIGTSKSIRTLRKECERLGQVDWPVLITGETGVGKELVVRLIHSSSERRDKPFVVLNCSMISDELAASELSGHAKGAFTGAVSSRTGLLETADGGTIFLDEIESLPRGAQAILLRVLDSGRIRRIGDNRERKIDIRVLSATSTSLDKLYAPDNFRHDLLGRMTILHVPPLRERKEDIPKLVEHFLHELGHQFSKEVQIEPEALDSLMRYDYPRNIRELKYILARAASESHSGVIDRSLLRLPSTAKPSSSRENIELLRAEFERAKDDLEQLRRTTIQANPIWEGQSFPTEDDYCFVLMPFLEADDIQNAYKNHIKSVLERCGLRCERADDIYDISGVMQSVWEGINRARLIVADLTGRNPNVFYELGIAHTLGKPVIMLTQSMDYVPFDLRHLRCIVYQYKPGSIEAFEQALEKTVRTVLSSTTSRPSHRIMHD